ncbi:hypothetical protein [Streptomyces virginiae]|uniref:hypothetical protein n=1 Tax=Streptomyces virginiae TaxID=1961 RepID=UPI0036FCE9D1
MRGSGLSRPASGTADAASGPGALGIGTILVRTRCGPRWPYGRTPGPRRIRWSAPTSPTSTRWAPRGAGRRRRALLAAIRDEYRALGRAELAALAELRWRARPLSPEPHPPRYAAPLSPT